MNARFLSSSDKKKLLAELGRFGVNDINYLFIESGKEKIRAFSGTLSRDEIVELGAMARVEIVGLYCARKEPFGLRIGFDMLHILSKQLTEEIIELSDEEFELWIAGRVLEKEAPVGVYVVRYKGDFVGCTYSTGTRLLNFVPKERQLRR